MLRITRRAGYRHSQFQYKTLISLVPRQSPTIPSDGSWTEHHVYTFWATLYRRVPDFSLCCAPPISLFWGDFPATNSDTGPEVELQKEEAPVSLRNHCHLAPLAPIPLGPRNPQGRWGGSLSYMEHSNEDLGERKQIKETFVPEQEFG